MQGQFVVKMSLRTTVSSTLTKIQWTEPGLSQGKKQQKKKLVNYSPSHKRKNAISPYFLYRSIVLYLSLCTPSAWKEPHIIFGPFIRNSLRRSYMYSNSIFNNLRGFGLHHDSDDNGCLWNCVSRYLIMGVFRLLPCHGSILRCYAI
jgi:hypothetical protein